MSEEVQALTVEVSEAVIKFHKADEMEKKAGELRSESRAIIIQALKDDIIEAGDLIAGDKKVSIVVPVKKGKPRAFDQSKATTFFHVIEDAYPMLLPAVEEKIVHTVNLEVLIALLRGVNENKAQIVEAVEKYLTPATEDTLMEPRVKAS